MSFIYQSFIYSLLTIHNLRNSFITLHLISNFLIFIFNLPKLILLDKFVVSISYSNAYCHWFVTHFKISGTSLHSISLDFGFTSNSLHKSFIYLFMHNSSLNWWLWVALILQNILAIFSSFILRKLNRLMGPLPSV